MYQRMQFKKISERCLCDKSQLWQEIVHCWSGKSKLQTVYAENGRRLWQEDRQLAKNNQSHKVYHLVDR